jgi:hypothetical protein
MAVGMIGGPRLCEPLLATGLGRFTGGAREQARYRPSEKNISPLAKRLGLRKKPRIIAPLGATAWCRLPAGRHTNYDKLARNYFSALCLVAAVAFWL